MGAETSKIFKLPSKARVWYLLSAVLMMLIIYYLLNHFFDGTTLLIIMITVMLMFMFLFLSSFKEKVSITPLEVIHIKLFNQQIVSMSDILDVKRGSGGSVSSDMWVGGIINLLVSTPLGGYVGGSGNGDLELQTRRGTIYLSGGLIERELDDIKKCILENMQTHYPENYDAMKAEEARQAREEVKRFWS